MSLRKPVHKAVTYWNLIGVLKHILSLGKELHEGPEPVAVAPYDAARRRREFLTRSCDRDQRARIKFKVLDDLEKQFLGLQDGVHVVRADSWRREEGATHVSPGHCASATAELSRGSADLSCQQVGLLNRPSSCSVSTIS